MTFEQQIHAMFDHIWDCEIEHPVFQDTVGELMEAVIQCYKNLPPIDQEFVTCKDCKYSVGEPIGDGRFRCLILDEFMYYCSDKERIKMDKSIAKQVTTTWYDPSKKVPSNSDFVVATVSGKVGEVTLDHELMIANWVADEGWYFYDEYIDAERDSYLIKVDAWCDLKPYR